MATFSTMQHIVLFILNSFFHDIKYLLPKYLNINYLSCNFFKKKYFSSITNGKKCFINGIKKVLRNRTFKYYNVDFLVFQPDFSQSFIKILAGCTIRICFRMMLINTAIQAGQTHI
jgi:hypothetical protein